MSVATMTGTAPDVNDARFRRAGVLRQVAVQFHHGHPRRGELTGEPLRAALGPGEDQCAVVAASQGGDNAHPVRRGDAEQVMDYLGRRGSRIDGVPGGMIKEAPREDVDCLVESGGEQHPLAISRSGLQQPAYDREEPEVGHVVGFVDHGDLGIAQMAVALLDQVSQASRAGDDDIGALSQRGYLRVLRGAAEDGDDGQAHGPGQRRENGLDLAGQFPGGYQHEAARTARHGVPAGQAGDERDRERERLA